MASFGSEGWRAPSFAASRGVCSQRRTSAVVAGNTSECSDRWIGMQCACGKYFWHSVLFPWARASAEHLRCRLSQHGSTCSATIPVMADSTGTYIRPAPRFPPGRSTAPGHRGRSHWQQSEFYSPPRSRSHRRRSRSRSRHHRSPRSSPERPVTLTSTGHEPPRGLTPAARHGRHRARRARGADALACWYCVACKNLRPAHYLQPRAEASQGMPCMQCPDGSVVALWCKPCWDGLRLGRSIHLLRLGSAGAGAAGSACAHAEGNQGDIVARPKTPPIVVKKSESQQQS